MAKRFTDTEKWKRPWFRELPIQYKILWLYILDNCDMAGVWYVDIKLASFYIENKIKKEDAIKYLSKQIKIIDNGARWWITDFVNFQYGELRESSRVHLAIIDLLKKYNLLDFVKIGNETPLNGSIKKYKKDSIHKRDGFSCLYCGNIFERDNLDVDHIIPLSNGGSNEKENLTSSCKQCNIKKSNLTLNDFVKTYEIDINEMIQRAKIRGLDVKGMLRVC